jgi:hypothetical protein
MPLYVAEHLVGEAIIRTRSSGQAPAALLPHLPSGPEQMRRLRHSHFVTAPHLPAMATGTNLRQGLAPA